MNHDFAAVATPAKLSASVAAVESSGFDERWAAWQAFEAERFRSVIPSPTDGVEACP
jgi:hypothetical protein